MNIVVHYFRSVTVSFLEVYNEVIRYLLNQHGQKRIDIHYNEGNGTTVTNLTIQPVKSAAELEKFISLAHNLRSTAATNFNAHSSRAHAITKIYIAGTNPQHGIAYKESVNLVDLAGSESARTSGSDCRLQETKNINKSLSTLGDVMYALCNKNKHIPYR
ncbi:hypothetical protein HUJ04_003018 [Dendroctonus ponderosae]|nr:hypothetical protein HUJ04_003018 [Dendroctonus ponderosae]